MASPSHPIHHHQSPQQSTSPTPPPAPDDPMPPPSHPSQAIESQQEEDKESSIPTRALPTWLSLPPELRHQIYDLLFPPRRSRRSLPRWQLKEASSGLLHPYYCRLPSADGAKIPLHLVSRAVAEDFRNYLDGCTEMRFRSLEELHKFATQKILGPGKRKEVEEVAGRRMTITFFFTWERRWCVLNGMGLEGRLKEAKGMGREWLREGVGTFRPERLVFALVDCDKWVVEKGRRWRFIRRLASVFVELLPEGFPRGRVFVSYRKMVPRQVDEDFCIEAVL